MGRLISLDFCHGGFMNRTVLFFVVFLGCPSYVVIADVTETLLEIRSLPVTNDLVNQSLDVLERDIGHARASLPEGMMSELDTALERRLRTLLEIPGHHITQEYSSSLVAHRILELSAEVGVVGEREFGTPSERSLAKKQLEDLIAYLESNSQIHKEVREIAVPQIRKILEAQQWDVFRDHYGVPLSKNEFVALEQIVTDAIVGLVQISESLSGSLPPSKIRPVAEIATQTRRAMLKYFQQVRPVEKNSPLARSMENWYRSQQSLLETVNSQMIQDEQIEIQAMQKLADANEEQMLHENSPEAVEAKMRAAKVARGEAAIQQLNDGEDSTGMPYWILIVLNTFFFVVIVVTLVLRKKA